MLHLKSELPLLVCRYCLQKTKAMTSTASSNSVTCESITVPSLGTSEFPSTSGSDDMYATVNAGLMAKIEMLESENIALKHKIDTREKPHFRLEDIMHDDHLVKAYTGF